MTLEPTGDGDFIRSIITHPRVWPRVSEDGQRPEDFQIHGQSIYLRYGDHGCFSFRPISSICWEEHVFMLQGTPDIDAASLEAVRWMFDRGAHKLIANVPSHNWHAAALARRTGYVDEGRIKEAIRWRGRLHDFIVLGMTCKHFQQSHQ